MRVYSVMPRIQSNNIAKSQQPFSEKGVTSVPSQTTNTLNSMYSMHITFTGNPERNVKQGISVSVEDSYIGLGMYKCGGAGQVADQLPNALNKAGMDMRHTVPYYSYNNPKGGIKVLIVPEGDEYKEALKKNRMPENHFISVPISDTKASIAKRLNVPEERVKFVVQDTPELPKKGDIIPPNNLKISPYRELIPTGVSGSIQRIDENNLDQLKTLPYKVYQMIIPGKSDIVYCVHTPDLAKFQKAYTYSPDLKDHPHVNLFTRDFGDAAADMMTKLNTESQGFFKPANIIAHCRTGFPITESIINRSYNDPLYRGMKVVDIYHNPMPNYQGTVGNILDFLRYKATPDDYKKLSSLMEFPQLIDIDRHRYNLSEEDKKLVDRVIKPFLQYYIDDNGNFNQSISPLIARKVNPYNISVNHVSHTFADEVIKYDDMARGLTSLFQEAEKEGDKIPGRPNGCNIDFMKINDPKATMGSGNGLSADMSWYTPYDPLNDSAEKVVKAKRANTKAFLDMVGEASEKRLDKLSNYTNASTEDALNQLFFSKDLIEKKRYVLGGLSKFDEKDIVWCGWGRSDAQKNYPTTLEGFYKFLKNKNVPDEVKKHAKLILGSGPEPWEMDDKGVGDFHRIKDIMYKIQTLDEGKYKLNVCYVNGFFPNRLVTCCTYGIFTSEGEPQGLSVPEALQSGTPVGSLNTGGAGEMVITAAKDTENANGFLTKDPFMINVKDLKWDEGTDLTKLTAEQIHDKRLEAASDEVAEMFAKMAKTYHETPDVYQKLVHNAGQSKFDWHNNNALNNGRSTLQLYMEDAFEIDKGWEGRNKNPLTRLVGEFNGKIQDMKRVVIEKVSDVQEAAKDTVETIIDGSKKVRNRWLRIVIGGGVALAAIGTGSYLYWKNKNKTQNTNTQQPTNNTATIDNNDKKQEINKVA